MGNESLLRSVAKKIPLARAAVNGIRHLAAYLRRARFALACKSVNPLLTLRHPGRWRVLLAMRKGVRGFYPPERNLVNNEQCFEGRNVIGYPALSYISRNGEKIGWSKGKYGTGEDSIPMLQVETDLKNNIPALIARHKPTLLVDFGTAIGGQALLFHDLASQYTTPEVISIDISPCRLEYKDYHDRHKTSERVQFLVGDGASPAISRQIIEAIQRHRQRPDGRVLLSFDDDHTYPHTYQELTTFAPHLRPGDVMLMQDTWDQGLRGHVFSPLFSVFKFLGENGKDWALDEAFLKQVQLPCNFIHGVLVRRG